MTTGARLAFVLLLIAVIAAAAFAYIQTQALDEARRAFETADARITAQAQALTVLVTDIAGTRTADEAAMTAAVGDVRSAAATLQAGSLATRAALGQSLTQAVGTATAAANRNAAAVAAADATRENLLATATAQAEARTQADAALAALRPQATSIVATVEAQAILLTRAADNLQAIQTQVAAVPTAGAAEIEPTAAATTADDDVRPLAQVAVDQLVLDDGFDAESVLTTVDLPDSGATRFEDGRMVFEMNAESQSGLTTLAPSVLADAYIEIALTIETCAPDSLLLMEIRTDEDLSVGYAVGFNCALANWAVFKRGTEQVELVDAGAVSSQQTGSRRVIAIEARGSVFTLYLDGQLIASFTDPDYSEGQFGFTLVGPEPARLALESFRLWTLLPQAADAGSTPTPIFDSRVLRDQLAGRLPNEITTEDWTWRVQGTPQRELNRIGSASVSWLMVEREGVRAVITLLVASQPDELAAFVTDSAASLSVEPLEQTPTGFPDNAVFGRTTDAWVALWSQSNVFISIIMPDEARVSEPMLLALSRALLDLFAD
jgi:hypothetical protein